jgi:DNA-directed RNA polymerase subunit M/transcription elongation factor TFIIS
VVDVSFLVPELRKVKDAQGNDVDLPEVQSGKSRRNFVKDPKTGKETVRRKQPVAQREHEALVLDTEGDVKDEMGMVEPTREYRGRQLNEEGLAEVDLRMEENVVGECPRCGGELYYDKSQPGDDVAYCPKCNYHLDTFEAGYAPKSETPHGPYKHYFDNTMDKSWSEFKKVKSETGEELDIPHPVKDPYDRFVEDKKEVKYNPFYVRPKSGRKKPRAQQIVGDIKEEGKSEVMNLPDKFKTRLMEHPGIDTLVEEKLKENETGKSCPRCGKMLYSEYPKDAEEPMYCPNCNYTNATHMGTPGAVPKKQPAKSLSYLSAGVRKAIESSWKMFEDSA